MHFNFFKKVFHLLIFWNNCLKYNDLEFFKNRRTFLYFEKGTGYRFDEFTKTPAWQAEKLL